MMANHKRALVVIALAGGLDVLFAGLFAKVEHISFAKSIYWAVVTATSVGYGDVTPSTWWGHVIAIGVMLTVIPLFAAVFSFVTSGLTATHINKSNDHHWGPGSTLHRKLDSLLESHGTLHSHIEQLMDNCDISAGNSDSSILEKGSKD